MDGFNSSMRWWPEQNVGAVMAFTMIDPVASSFLLVRADVDGKKRLIKRAGRVGWA